MLHNANNDMNCSDLTQSQPLSPGVSLSQRIGIGSRQHLSKRIKIHTPWT